MKYTKTTEKPVAQTVSLLEAGARWNDFGVLHIHDLKTTLNNKGIAFDRECQTFEICNPTYANGVLSCSVFLPAGDSSHLKSYPKGYRQAMKHLAGKEKISWLENDWSRH